MVRKKFEIKAVYDEDLKEYLTAIGLLGDLEAGKFFCVSCGNQITLDNLGALIPGDQTISFCCNLEECLYKSGTLETEGELRAR